MIKCRWNLGDGSDADDQPGRLAPRDPDIGVLAIGPRQPRGVSLGYAQGKKAWLWRPIANLALAFARKDCGADHVQIGCQPGLRGAVLGIGNGLAERVPRSQERRPVRPTRTQQRVAVHTSRADAQCEGAGRVDPVIRRAIGLIQCVVQQKTLRG